jgi:hypothetical protein
VQSCANQNLKKKLKENISCTKCQDGLFYNHDHGTIAIGMVFGFNGYLSLPITSRKGMGSKCMDKGRREVWHNHTSLLPLSMHLLPICKVSHNLFHTLKENSSSSFVFFSSSSWFSMFISLLRLTLK